MSNLVLVTTTVREKKLGPDREVLSAPGTGMTEHLGVDLDLVKDLRDGYPPVHSAPERTEEVEMSSNLENAKTRARDEMIRDREFEKILSALLAAKNENIEVVLRDLTIPRVRLALLASARNMISRFVQFLNV